MHSMTFKPMINFSKTIQNFLLINVCHIVKPRVILLSKRIWLSNSLNIFEEVFLNGFFLFSASCTNNDWPNFFRFSYDVSYIITREIFSFLNSVFAHWKFHSKEERFSINWLTAFYIITWETSHFFNV